jgi:RHS repeat-associated protein
VYGLGLAYADTTVTGTSPSHTAEVYHNDGLGSARALTDATGRVVQTYQTDEFGVSTTMQGTSNQPFGFTGEQGDPESGFVFLRARMYDPSTGRFLQRDPLTKSGPGILGWNRFAYVGDNPINHTDASGLKPASMDPGPCIPMLDGACVSPWPIPGATPTPTPKQTTANPSCPQQAETSFNGLVQGNNLMVRTPATDVPGGTCHVNAELAGMTSLNNWHIYWTDSGFWGWAMRAGQIDWSSPVTFGLSALDTAYEIEQDMETFLSVSNLTRAENTVLYEFTSALSQQLSELQSYGITQPTIRP